MAEIGTHALWGVAEELQEGFGLLLQGVFGSGAKTNVFCWMIDGYP